MYVCMCVCIYVFYLFLLYSDLKFAYKWEFFLEVQKTRLKKKINSLRRKRSLSRLRTDLNAAKETLFNGFLKAF